MEEWSTGILEKWSTAHSKVVLVPSHRYPFSEGTPMGWKGVPSTQ
jgi:hypothetical protein